MPRLQVLNGKRQGVIFEVKPGTKHVVGHRQTASITIDDPWVSWDHAQLFWNPDDGECWIEDLGSTNGTYVNCVRVKRERLRHEDIIFLGKTHVIYLCPAEEHSGMGLDDAPLSGLEPGDPAVALSAGGAPLDLSFPMDSLPVAAAAQPPPPPPLLVSSEASPFLDESGLTPLRALKEEPRPAHGGAPPGAPPPARGKAKDPFADSGVDPFSSGPDYVALDAPPGAAPPRAKGSPRPGPEGSQRATTAASSASRREPVAPGYTIPLEASAERPPTGGPPRGLPAGPRAPFAETNADEANPYLQGSQRGLDLNAFQPEDDVRPPRPSHQEIANLLGGGYDDLDAILGDGRALTPSPQPVPPELRGDPLPRVAKGTTTRVDPEQAKPPPPPGPKKSGPSGRQPSITDIPPSEMRTRLVDADMVAQILREDAAGSAQPASAAPPPPPPPAPIPAEGTAERSGLPQDLGQLAFERARLEDEVRRLRAALTAATARDPQAVRAAAETLRDQELGRLARRVAELEQEVVQRRQELQGRERELNHVTEAMIDKEDEIETLQRELARLRGGNPGSDPRAARASAGSGRHRR